MNPCKKERHFDFPLLAKPLWNIAQIDYWPFDFGQFDQFLNLTRAFIRCTSGMNLVILPQTYTKLLRVHVHVCIVHFKKIVSTNNCWWRRCWRQKKWYMYLCLAPATQTRQKTKFFHSSSVGLHVARLQIIWCMGIASTYMYLQIVVSCKKKKINFANNPTFQLHLPYM